MHDQEDNVEISASRIRIGLAIWVISYLPFPLIVVGILHAMGQLSNPKNTSQLVLVMYVIQFIIGFIGLIIAGRDTITLFKKVGYRRLPGCVWRAIRYGQIDPG
jgi:hypothetical protein